ncbi:MAG: HigA family addiction module antitoxin [Betaproteobacteria bacterium]|nr:HigA family addiction module antitoxin [Betaproteobacteria bacterium]
MVKNGMRPVHPGEILREEYLVPLGMSVNALALALAVPATRLHEIVKERRGITADTAYRLARHFDSTPEFWLNLQAAYDLKTLPARAEIERRVHRYEPLVA